MSRRCSTLGGWRAFGAFRAPGSELRARATATAATVGLAGKLARSVGAISVGELQRALFARLMLQDAAIILLDEPFAAVDQRTSEHLLSLIVSWHSEGRTVAVVLHDLDQVRAYFPETLLLARECVAWGPTREVLMPHNLRRARQMSELRSDEAENYRPAPAARPIRPTSRSNLLSANGEKNAPRGSRSERSGRSIQ